jgi:hypothetical protein
MVTNFQSKQVRLVDIQDKSKVTSQFCKSVKDRDSSFVTRKMDLKSEVGRLVISSSKTNNKSLTG